MSLDSTPASAAQNARTAVPVHSAFAILKSRTITTSRSHIIFSCVNTLVGIYSGVLHCQQRPPNILIVHQYTLGRFVIFHLASGSLRYTTQTVLFFFSGFFHPSLRNMNRTLMLHKRILRLVAYFLAYHCPPKYSGSWILFSAHRR